MGKYPSEDLIRFIARNFYKSKDRKSVKILEVGSGTGANLWFLAREGFTCYGIEGSQIGIDRCISRLDNEVPGWKGHIVQGDLVNLPFDNDFFDAVIDNEAIYCNSFSLSMKAYDSIYRVLKPQGKLFTRTFSTETAGFNTGVELDYHRYIPNSGVLKDRGPARFSSQEDIKKLLGQYSDIDLDRITRGFEQSGIVSEFIAIATK